MAAVAGLRRRERSSSHRSAAALWGDPAAIERARSRSRPPASRCSGLDPPPRRCPAARRGDGHDGIPVTTASRPSSTRGRGSADVVEAALRRGGIPAGSDDRLSLATCSTATRAARAPTRRHCLERRASHRPHSQPARGARSCLSSIRDRPAASRGSTSASSSEGQAIRGRLPLVAASSRSSSSTVAAHSARARLRDRRDRRPRVSGCRLTRVGPTSRGASSKARPVRRRRSATAAGWPSCSSIQTYVITYSTMSVNGDTATRPTGDAGGRRRVQARCARRWASRCATWPSAAGSARRCSPRSSAGRPARRWRSRRRSPPASS